MRNIITIGALVGGICIGYLVRSSEVYDLKSKIATPDTSGLCDTYIRSQVEKARTDEQATCDARVNKAIVNAANNLPSALEQFAEGIDQTVNGYRSGSLGYAMIVQEKKRQSAGLARASTSLRGASAYLLLIQTAETAPMTFGIDGVPTNSFDILRYDRLGELMGAKRDYSAGQ